MRKYISKSGLILGGLLAVAVQLQGCSMSGMQRVFLAEDQGFFELRTDAEGLRAWNDGQNGLVTTGKASPDTKDAYHKLREQQNQTRALRWISGAKKTEGGAK